MGGVSQNINKGNQMRIHHWTDIKKKTMSPEKLQQLEQEVEQELLEMTLGELRKETGLTQQEIAQAMSMHQSELSRVEHRHDHLLSTLRNYVEALGGELEVFAVIHKKRVRLRGI